MEKIQWQISVPIFRKTIILKQLGLAIGIPFGLVALVIGLSSGKNIYTLYGLGLIVALLFFTWLFIMAVYRGKYEVEFVLDQKGVLCRTQAKQAKKNRVINTLTVILGLLTGKPTTAGAGMLAQSRQEVSLRWIRVTRVNYKPKAVPSFCGAAGRKTLLYFARTRIMNRLKLLCVGIHRFPGRGMTDEKKALAKDFHHIIGNGTPHLGSRKNYAGYHR